MSKINHPDRIKADVYCHVFDPFHIICWNLIDEIQIELINSGNDLMRTDCFKTAN